jgi:FMN phosphatase YigB (HAD superfamily)
MVEKELKTVSLTVLAEALQNTRYELVSTDLFDTVLLRDHTIESDRLAIACRRAAPLLGVDAAALTQFRWSLQRSAYQAVAIERPAGDASLADLCAVAARAFGLDASAGEILRRIEVDVDIEHLRPNRPLLDLFDRITRAGRRVIALSDTYLSRADLRRVLAAVAGAHPIAEVYSSADLGLTKHVGTAYAAVARRENVHPGRILHVGDNHPADVLMAGRADWAALHLPRGPWGRIGKAAGKVLALRTKFRSVQ